MSTQKKTVFHHIRNFISKYLLLILGIISFVLGIALMLIPFLPIGYIFVFISFFLLASYLPPLKKFLNYLKTKDKRGILKKVEQRIKKFQDKISPKKSENATAKIDKPEPQE